MKTKTVANALLMLPDGRWVMQRRTEDAPTDPGLLSFFGGGTKPGEKPEQTFVRELGEETNLPLGKYALAGVFIDTKHYPLEVEVHAYRMEIQSVDFEVYEGAGAEAYSPDELAKRSDISGIAISTLEQFGAKTWH